MAAENVLGIIGCIVLADELSCVLSRDRDLYRTFIVDNDEGAILMDKLARREIEAEMLDPGDLERARAQDRYSVLIWMNPAGRKEAGELRSAVRKAAEGLSGSVGLCFCFYGRCRNMLANIDQMGEEAGTPMMIITDLRGEEVDDCISANIGGSMEYRDVLSEHQDTFFVTSGYVENLDRRGDWPFGPGGAEALPVLWRTGCTRVTRLENGLGEKDRYEERVDALARLLDLEVSAMPCGLGVFEHSYSTAKKKLAMMRPLTLAPMTGGRASLSGRRSPS